jgi:hypothetical protein
MTERTTSISFQIDENILLPVKKTNEEELEEIFNDAKR